MPVIYSLDTKKARLEATLEKLNGSGSGAPELVIGTARMGTVLARIPLEQPAGVVDGDMLELSGLPMSAAAIGSGVAAAAELRAPDGKTIVSGLTVGEADADFVLQSAVVTAGQTVMLQSGALQHS